MYLSRIRIRHYKSLDDVSIDFSHPITVLVGPNAVGKSNVVDCLRFVRDAVSIDLEHAVSARGGIGRVRQYSRTRPYKLSIDITLREEEELESDRLSQYEFAIESLTASNYLVATERASYFEPTGEKGNAIAAKFSRDRQGVVRTTDGKKDFKVTTDQLVLGQVRALFRPPAWPVERFIRDWRFSALYPNRLREPSTPDKDTVLAEDGQNWASVIKALRRTGRGKESLERVFEAMRGVIPSFEDVTVTTVGSYLVPRFRFALGTNEHVDFDPVQLSDGTLRIFGILLALYQVPAPKLLLIEEPEQTVHPGVLGVLADAFREAAERTQLVVTTHSPNFIDYFKPDEVRVVSLHKGLTHVEPVKRTQVEAVKRKLMSLQDFMLAEGLQPENA
jgi:predicted ATPase